jgi:hypothetical protein
VFGCRRSERSSGPSFERSWIGPAPSWRDPELRGVRAAYAAE